MRTLLTGGSGRLGKEIVRLDPNVIAPSHNKLDITDRAKVQEILNIVQPEAIIHLAAYTSVALAETDRERCWKVNVEGTRNMAELSTEGTYLVFLSTACVFRGDRGNYTEDDIPSPENFYGLTKLLGEMIVQQGGHKRWLIVRTNFVERKPWKYPKAFIDRHGSYLYTDEVAQRVLELVKKGATGLIHVCGNERMSMYELAKRLKPEVQPWTLEEYYAENPDAARLTRDMTLKTNRTDA